MILLEGMNTKMKFEVLVSREMTSIAPEMIKSLLDKNHKGRYRFIPNRSSFCYIIELNGDLSRSDRVKLELLPIVTSVKWYDNG